MKQTSAQLRATKKYQSKFRVLRVRVLPSEKDIILVHATSHNESISAFIKRAIFETMARDNQK